MRFGPSKDDELDDDITSANAAGGAEEEPSQIPLMTGGGRPEGLDGDIDYSSLDSGSKLFNKGTMLVVAIMLIAAGALYAMRVSQGDGKQSEEVRKSEAKVEQLMTQLKSAQALGGNHHLAKGSIEALLNDSEFIIAQLDVDPSKRQVPVEFTKKNPFYLFMERPIDAAPVKVEPNAEEKRLAELMKKLETEISRMKIQSILPNGRKPVAIIDNKIVQVGEAVGNFRVKEIQKLAVILEADGKEFSLSIESDPNIKAIKGR